MAKAGTAVAVEFHVGDIVAVPPDVDNLLAGRVGVAVVVQPTVTSINGIAVAGNGAVQVKFDHGPRAWIDAAELELVYPSGE
jgi:hypothetical protein